MSSNFSAYFIHCLTNMHVGSGDATYGVVDKLVQRDPVSNFPTIHASSLKGGLREHFENVWGKKDPRIFFIFGNENERTEENNNQKGNYKFLNADLAALPVRSNYAQYAITFSPELAKSVNSKSELLTGKSIFNLPEAANKIFCRDNPGYEVYLEDEKAEWKNYNTPLNISTELKSFSSYFAYEDDVRFAQHIKNLPVLARNYLVDGESKNLWYEEIVPHQTIFITYVFRDNNHFGEFEKVLLNDVIQIGANASIGYGLCKFYKIKAT